MHANAAARLLGHWVRFGPMVVGPLGPFACIPAYPWLICGKKLASLLRMGNARKAEWRFERRAGTGDYSPSRPVRSHGRETRDAAVDDRHMSVLGPDSECGTATKTLN